MKPKLTPEELLDKRARDNLNSTANRLRSKYSFGLIKTYLDILRVAGHPDEYIFKTYFPSELNRSITYDDIKEFISDRQIEYSTAQWLKANPPIISLDIPEVESRYERLAEEEDNKSKIEDVEYEKSPKTKAFLFWFQKKAIKQLLHKVFVEKRRGNLLVAGTGTGKTFIAGEFFRKLLDSQFHIGKTQSPWPYIYVTRASVVEQTKRVFKEFFQIDTQEEVLVINIDQLRSKFGELFVNEKVYIERGEEVYKWEWRNHIYPIFIWWDECQAVKNESSQQSRIAQSYNEIPSENTYQIFGSATPGTRIAEFKCAVVASRIPYTYGVAENAPMVNSHWNDFATNIASDYGRLEIKPEEHSPPAINRLMDYMQDYIVRVKGVKSQFHAINRLEMISFTTHEGQQFYDDAWERFLTTKSKNENDAMLTAGQARMNILAALTVFRIAAESNPDRVQLLAREMFQAVQRGFAAVCALNFKISIVKIVKILVNDFNIPRDQISLIWGGTPQANKKQKAKAAIINNPFALAAMAEEGISLEDIDLDEVEAKEEEQLDPTLRLGAQSQKERQKEIDKFQRGESLFCFYTFRAGGVGLSLHHSDDLTKEKVRHKESGYAVEEDIPKIPTRPRKVFVAPTYSAIELVQGLGRCPRLTSLSDTEQVLYFFSGTVEERVAHVVGMKLRCLTKVVRQKESWENVIVGHYTDEEIERRHMTEKPIDNGDDNEGLFEEDDEDDDS